MKGTVTNTDNDLEILKLLYVEWENRQTLLWSLMTKSTIFVFIVILLPAISKNFIFDPDKLKNVPLQILPIIGLVFAVLGGILAHKETCRLIQIKGCIKRNANLISEKFTEAYLETNKANKIIPWAVMMSQVVAAVIMLISFF